jgi:tetratricopeptide (TPR) repeat protein
MRRRARIAVISQRRDIRLIALLASMAALILALAVAEAWSMPSGGGGAPSTIDRPRERRPTATTSDEYEAAERAIKEGDYQTAIAELEKVNLLFPNNADVLNYLGYAHRKLGQTEKALAYYQQALAVDPEHRAAHEYLGELYLQMKDLAKAEEQLTILQSLCRRCEERKELTRKIEEYKAASAAEAAPTQ